MARPAIRGDQPAQHVPQPAARMEELFGSHHAAVVRYVRRRMPAAGVDDVVAETFLAWRRVEHVPYDALPWLLAVARNIIGTHRRGSRRWLALHVRLRSVRATDGVAHAAPEPPGSVAAALASLSDRDREALTLIAWEGLTPTQAAAVLGESPGTFRVRLHRAKRRLRRLLEQPEEQLDLAATHPLRPQGGQP